MEWPSETDTASPSPAGSKRDSIFLFHRYSTPDILKQNGEATPSTGEGDAQETMALDEAPEEETSLKQGIEDRLLVKDRKASRAQKRAVAKRVSSLLEDLNTELEEMSNAETLKKLDLQIHQLNEVLKVRWVDERIDGLVDSFKRFINGCIKENEQSLFERVQEHVWDVFQNQNKETIC